MEEEKVAPEEQIELKQKVKVKWKGWGVVTGIAIGIVVSGSVASAVYFYTKSKQPVVTPPVSQPTAAPTEAVTPTEVEAEIKWISPPIEISKLDIFKAQGMAEEMTMMVNEARFYKTAQLKDGSTLINMVVPYGMGRSVIRFMEKPDMGYEYLAAYLDNWEKEELAQVLLPNILASNRRFDGLETPEEMTGEGKTNVKGFTAYTSFEELENPQNVAGSLYRRDVKILDSNQIFARVIYLRLKDDTMASYNLKNAAYPDDQKPFLDWNDEISNSSIVFRQAVVSDCSAGMASSVPIIKDGSSLLAGKIEVGKWQGQPIYQIKDPNSELVSKLYNNYKIGRDYPSAAPIVSIEEFANQKNHFLWRDQLGDWQIFVNQDYSPMAECGKPVIYLYPQEKTEVRVSVGAQISKSEPLYPQGGWQVTAYPEGRLIYQGKEYDSLFWEGLGEGVYPNLRNQGVMVKQTEMVTVLNQQLRQLGLNEKEAVDFMEFWQERLPKDPWVRLTWLGTREMDRLAPLAVEPKPDSRIRIFLEFEGMGQPRELVPQKLTVGERKGFVLVEWGGLLIGE